MIIDYLVLVDLILKPEIDQFHCVLLLEVSLLSRLSIFKGKIAESDSRLISTMEGILTYFIPDRP